MPAFQQLILLTALPVLCAALFWSSSKQDFAQLVLSSWSSLKSAPQVTLGQGIVVGTVIDDSFPQPVEAFIGLPYAQPPIGDRRFRRASPLPDSQEQFKATKYGPM